MDLYNYIEAKVRVSFSLLIVLEDKELAFLDTVNNEEVFIKNIAINTSKIITDIAFDSGIQIKLSKVDDEINDYLINKVFGRLEAWAEETLDIGWNDSL